MAELRERAMLAVAGTQKPCRKAIAANGGCIADYGSCYCAETADAALGEVAAWLESDEVLGTIAMEILGRTAPAGAKAARDALVALVRGRGE